MNDYEWDNLTPAERDRLDPGSVEMVTLWSVGRNMPGYLPDADEPTLCTTWEDAKSSLLWEMDSMADFISEGDEDDEQNESWYDNIRIAIRELKESTGPEFGTIVDDCPSGTSYWIVQETMTVAEAIENGVEL